MADIQHFVKSRTTPGNLNLPRHTIEAQLVEGSAVIADFTGVNVIRWPDVLATLSPDQQDEIMELVAQPIVLMRAGG